MKEFERVQIESRVELRAWLEANHTRTESIWLVKFKKHVPDKYVSWEDVVQEARLRLLKQTTPRGQRLANLTY